MQKQGIYTILSNSPLTSSVYRMVLSGDTSAITASGQFINIRLDSLFLRRPISVCDYDRYTLTIIYKVVGEGTARMSSMQAGERLDCLTGLGNGFTPCATSVSPLLVGGGVGVPPLYNLCKRLIAEGRKVGVVLGFNTAEEIFYESEFRATGATVYVATADGSAGCKGFVTDAIVRNSINFDYFYACGPMPMLRALCQTCEQEGQVSLEERMGCGFGVCMGCSCQTTTGAKRLCKEGPVLKKGEIVW